MWRGFKSHSSHFVDIPKQSIVSCILNTCTWYHLPSSISTAAWVELVGGGGQQLVSEQREDQGPCCEQLNFGIIGGGR
eukprot:UN11476